ncbi:MAG: protein kinase [Polyangiaceae bacterium]|nr:protein kinase [Polyangiaceae bacterium]MCL4750066.1 protein kinase [Myxococcales bacterium]
MSTELVPGSIFASDYRVVRPLSSGGMGSLWVVEQLSTGAPRALKLMRRELVTSPRLRERFEQEARIGARVPSDHVVSVHAAGIDAATGFPFLVMELLEGQDLWSASPQSAPWAPEDVCEIFEQLCHGLSAAHQLGIVHRDIKPENVFLAGPRRAGVRFFVKILDFGIAKIAAGAVDTPTAAVGTPMWMAPEQARDSVQVSPATDVWALGLLAFWMLTGRSYLRSANETRIDFGRLLMEILHDELVPASARAAELGAPGSIPVGFDAWFSRVVARNPSDRFPDAGAAFEALAPVLRSARAGAAPTQLAPTQAGTSGAADQGTQLGPPPSPSAFGPPPRTQVDPLPAAAEPRSPAPTAPAPGRRALLAGAGALLLALLVAAIWLALSNVGRAPPAAAAASASAREPVGLSSEQLQGVVSRRTRELASCGREVQERTRAELELVVSPAGEVAHARVAVGDPGADVEKCLIEQVTAWRFPRSGKETTVRVPVVFSVQKSKGISKDPYRSCDPPYRVDQAGVKRMKPECL